MASPRRLIASAAVAAGLLGGGVVGFVLGSPGVSGAQTTTVPNAPGTPAPDNGQPNTARPPHGDGQNCPHMNGGGGTAPNGAAPGTGTGTSFGVRRGGFTGGRV